MFPGPTCLGPTPFLPGPVFCMDMGALADELPSAPAMLSHLSQSEASFGVQESAERGLGGHGFEPIDLLCLFQSC